MNTNFYLLTDLSKRRTLRLDGIATQRIREGDWGARSADVIKDINEAILDNVQTDQAMKRRFA